MKKITGNMINICLAAALLTACMGEKTEDEAGRVSMVTAIETDRNEQPQTQTQASPEPAKTPTPVPSDMEEEKRLMMRVQGNGYSILFELNDSPASKSLYHQLPLNIEIENFSNNEKIFYPPDELELGDTPLTEGGGAGGLAYFAPWGDVVMYYGEFGPYGGLYDLGTAVSGGEWIEELSGEVLLKQDGN